MNVSRVPLIASLNLAQLPVAMQALLLVLLGHHNTGSYTIAGAGAAAAAAGFGLSAPLLGRLLGRVGHRGVLLCTGMLSLAAHCALAMTTAPAPFLIIAGLLGLTIPPAMSSVRAVLAELVPGEPLRRAYSINAVAQELIYVLGPLWVTLWITLAGPAAALLACAIVGTFGVLVTVLLLPRGLRRERQRGPTLLRRPGVRTLLAVTLCYMISMGAMWVLVPAFATHLGHPDRAGLLVAIWSLGSTAGGIAFSFTRGVPLRRAYLALLAILAATSLPLALASSMWVFAILVTMYGLALAPWLATADGLLAAAAPPPRTGEAYGWIVTAGQIGTAIGGITAGSVADHQATGIPFLLVTAALCAALTVAVARRENLRPTENPPPAMPPTAGVAPLPTAHEGRPR